MRIKTVVTFAVAVAISLVAAGYRFGDSSHAIGMVSANGGKARHPTVLQSGWDRYTQVATATVLPPYHGDVRVALEGPPVLDWEIRYSGPVIDLGLRRHPEFRDNILYGVEAGDRLAFWVLIRPLAIDPVCRMTVDENSPSTTYNGKTWRFCCRGCLAMFEAAPEEFQDSAGPEGKYNLAFYDTKTGQSVLQLPLIIKGKEAQHESGGHH